MSEFRLSNAQIAAYHRDGYVMVPGLFNREEVDIVHNVALSDRAIKNAGAMNDAAGGASKIWLTTELRQDVYTAISNSDRVVGPMEQLLSDEVLFYHHKMMLKEPRVGGAWEWHQDYGYWYNDGFLFPNMASCMVAVDRASKENGCLQVLRGSHLMGRIEHGTVGAQSGANVDRVAQAMKRLELVYCEMQPGTGLFFHSNTLHRSDQNKSEYSRWSFISCYTAKSNRSYAEDGRSFVQCKPVEKWPASRIKELAEQQLKAGESATPESMVRAKA